MPRSKETPPRKPGRPPHQPTERERALVEGMALGGVPTDRIAKHIGISETTLRLHYNSELEVSKDKVTAAVARSLVHLALHSTHDLARFNAAKFYLSTRAGWKTPEADGIKAARQAAALEPPPPGSEWDELLRVEPLPRH